jgi:small GTP-binding protein
VLIEGYTRIVLLGFQNSGKTTLMLKLKDPKKIVTENPRPTYGIEFYDRITKLQGVEFGLIDVGGQEILQKIFWELGLNKCDAIIYMIDGTLKEDSSLFSQSKNAFTYAIDIFPDDRPILILINKQDLIDLKPLTIKEAFNLYSMERLENQEKIFKIDVCSAKFGFNVESSLEWFLSL